MTLQFPPPSPRIEPSTPTPNVETQTSPEALGEGGTMVHALAPYHQPQAQSEAEIEEAKIASAFDARWGFAGIRIASDLDYVSFEPSYDSHKHGGDVLDRVAGWAVDQDLPLGPLVAILELVASKAEEQKAQDMLGVFRGKIKDALEYLRDFGWRGAELAKRADVLEANLPDTLRISK
jgi:hypothetical protein